MFENSESSDRGNLGTVIKTINVKFSPILLSPMKTDDKLGRKSRHGAGDLAERL